jgi:[ribosomal protein S5]-alanine N-acetyltransferase
MSRQAAELTSNLLRLPRLLSGSEPPATRLVGKRVSLRPPARDDFESWARVREASRRFLEPWEPTWSSDALTRGAYRQRLFHYAAEWRSGQGYNFFLFRNADGILLGGIGLSQVRHGVAECGSLGYWMGERYARQGYMTDALRLTLDFCFSRLKLHRVEAACLPHNLASRRVLTKCGFREEGYAKEYLCIDGRWQDHVLFGTLREEWAARTES